MYNADSHQLLASKLAEVLADLNVAASVSQGFHWNVKGSDFSEYHAFFGAIYEDIQGSIDPTAENILKLGFDSPYLLQDFLSLTSIQAVRVRSNDPETMTYQLLHINAQLLECLNGAFSTADECNAQGVADFLAGRIDAHMKWQWQLAASLGMSVNEALGAAPAPVPTPATYVAEPVENPDADEFIDVAEFNG